MKQLSHILFAALFFIATLQPYQAMAQETFDLPPLSESSQGPDSSKFVRVFADLHGRAGTVVYSTSNMNGMMNDLEALDVLARASISERAGTEIVQRLSAALDLYAAILLDERIKGEDKIELTSRMEGGIYQAVVTLLRHYKADPIDPKTREIPDRNIIEKIRHEIFSVDRLSFISRPQDGFGTKVYSPFEKIFRNQATQMILSKMQEVGFRAHTTKDGDGGVIAENSRQMMQEIAVDNSLKSINDRRTAQLATVGAYGLITILSVVFIVDYMGGINALLGGYGRTDMTRAITSVINLALGASIMMLKTASMRGHIKRMVLDLQEILKDPKNFANRKPMRKSLAAYIFRKSIEIDEKAGVFNGEIAATAPGGGGGGGAKRCGGTHSRYLFE